MKEKNISTFKLMNLIIFNLNYLIKSKIFSHQILLIMNICISLTNEIKKFRTINEKLKLINELQQNNINIK